jgi:tripartite-type tricarboxylate transporter receptor subunit TctC
VKELIAFAKANPGKLSYGSSGTGSFQHLLGEMFKAAAGIDLLHVPYKGSGQGVTALMSKEVTMVLSGPPAVLPNIRSGRFRALAVTSGQRSPALPDTPTLIESGLAGFNMTAWHCLMAPAGTPRPIIDTIRSAMVKSMSSPAVVERLQAEGAPATPTTPEELAELIHSDLAVWAKAVKIAGIKQQQ